MIPLGTAPVQSMPTTLDRALTFARFGSTERILLGLAVEQLDWDQWSGEPWESQAQRFPITLDLAELADQTDIPRVALRRALNRLFDSNVLRRSADGSFRLIGDISRWTFPGLGRPRLGSRLLAFCRADRPLAAYLDIH